MDRSYSKKLLKRVIMDFIQTMYQNDVDSRWGSVVQAKECVSRLLEIAKEINISIIIVSHINKDGVIAGSKVHEHIIDIIVYFEG
jgi:DNA repair protein RadA/Sms